MLRAVDQVAAMSKKQRDAFTRNPDALDPITAEVLVTASASLTDFQDASPTAHRPSTARTACRQVELKELERAIEAGESAVEARRDEIRLKAGEFDPHKFDQLAAPIELAKNGDLTALRLCLERIIPPRKDRPVNFDMPEIKTPSDALVAATAIMRAVANGDLTPSEAAELSKIIDSFVRVAETADLGERVKQLEQIADYR
jgi:hypothetical protein